MAFRKIGFYSNDISIYPYDREIHRIFLKQVLILNANVISSMVVAFEFAFYWREMTEVSPALNQN